MAITAYGYIITTANGELIMGVGRTELDAVNHAQTEIENARLDVTTDDMPTVPCTRDLYEEVRGFGAPSGWHVTHGIAHMAHEEA
jgi:hypothetical protein